MRGITSNQDVLYMLGIVRSVDHVSLGSSGLPEHDATEIIRVATHVLCNQNVDLFGREIISRIGGALACRKTDIKLCCGIASVLDDADPCIIIEAAIAAAVSVEKVPGRASCRVIELDPDKVKDRGRNCETQLLVRDRALGCARNVEGTVRDQIEVSPESIDHGGITCGRSETRPGPVYNDNLEEKLTKATVVLDVKVKPIYNNISKRTGAIHGHPRVVYGPKGRPEEVGK